jgi:beta-glucosidase
LPPGSTGSAAPKWLPSRPRSIREGHQNFQADLQLHANSAGLLPLDKTKLKTIAVVGPHANHVLLDWYSGTPPYSVSPRAGIEKAIGRDTCG